MQRGHGAGSETTPGSRVANLIIIVAFPAVVPKLTNSANHAGRPSRRTVSSARTSTCSPRPVSTCPRST